MKDRKYWLHSGFYSLLQRIVVTLFGFGTFYLLVRLLSKEDYGIWALFMIVTGIIEAVRNSFVQNALIKYLVTATSEESPRILTASLMLNGIVSFMSIIALFICSAWLGHLYDAPALEYMFNIYILNTLLLIPFFQFQYIEQAHYKFTGLFYSNAIRQGLLFAFVLGGVLFSWRVDLYTLSTFLLFSTFAGTIVGYFFARPFLHYSKKIDWEWVKKLFHFGKYTIAIGISSSLFRSIDQLFLGNMVSKVAVASYNIAYRITNLIEVPIGSMAAMIFPQGARRMEEHGSASVKYLYEKSVGVTLAVLLPFFLVLLLFPSILIRLIAGKSFEDAVPILQVTVFYCLLVPFGRQFGVIMDAIGRTRITFRVVMLTLVSTLVFDYLGIRFFGLIGAAWGTFAGQLVGFVVGQIVLKKELNVSLWNPFLYAWQTYREALQFSCRFVFGRKGE